MPAFSDSSRGQTAADTFSSAGSGGASNPGGFGNNGGGDNNDPYQGYVRASQPRGLNKVTRTVGDGIQTARNFFSNPVNRRGIIGSLIGSAFLGPLGLLLGGYLGKNYGGGITSAIGDKTTETLDKFKRLGNPDKYLSQIKTPDREKRTGIRNTMMAKQLTLPFDLINTGDPFKDNYYDREGNYIGPSVAEAPQLTLPFDLINTGDPFKDNYYDREGNYIGPTTVG